MSRDTFSKPPVTYPLTECRIFMISPLLQNGQYANYITTRYHLLDKKGEKAFSLLQVHFNLT
jgi:hypothetical protein